ncbi:hypothetical protein Rsub_00528 [Raphidocelis subcapitata]|uniref:Uncharacterized protein n=1 Tax=Raphidocelis subcapitata TaxID=307507 RepID=A0A2V0NSA4_9CHLO|nr:hypothetical protein Rsub_00528 [Raphidocelis subcapitata]|eukprot:GBF87817.1 hypothetical protein Rsub_00528 [Raphidocelis subcapitata]
MPTVAAAPPAASTSPHQPKTVLDAGNLCVVYSGAAPDYIKLIKQIRISPLIFTATGAISPRTRKRFINFSLRETLFGGAFICHVSRKALEYRNNLPLPIGGMGTVVLAAEWRLGQPVHKPRLMVALGGDAGAAVMRPGSISWRKAFFPMTGGMGRRIGLETAADVGVAMQHDFNNDSNTSGLKVNFDIRELNLVVRV